MAINLSTLLGANLGQVFKDVVGSFKLDPEKKAELQAALAQNDAAIAQKQLDLEGKMQDAISVEIQSAAEIIKAEAQSQSWLPRNVRPLLLLSWGSAVTLNLFVPIIARFWIPGFQPLPIDPWIYKLIMLAFTGYVTARTIEKIKDAN